MLNFSLDICDFYAILIVERMNKMKKIHIKINNTDKLYQEILQKVKKQFEWAQSMAVECNRPETPYFQQYFYMSFDKPNFKSEKIKDKLYIKALREYGIIPQEGEKVKEYLYNAFETRFGKE